MSYDTTGTYTNVSGATTAAAGQVVQSSTWNNIFTDYGTAMTQVMQQLINTMTDRNILSANGCFEIWQRGSGDTASIAVGASSTAYTADRWYLTTGANQASTVSAQTTLVTNGSRLSGKIQRNNAQTGTTAMTFGYPLDTDEIVRMRGNKVTFKFNTKAGANWSPASGTLSYALYVGTGAVAKRGGGFTSETTVLSGTLNLTTNVATGSATSSAVVPTTATQAELQFTWTPVGTAGADDSFYLDDCSIEVNQTSTTWTVMAFDRIPVEIMLLKCKKHYQKTFEYNTAPAQNAGLAGAIAKITEQTANRSGVWIELQEMRTIPTVTTYNPSGATANWLDQTATASLAVTVDTTAPGSKAILIMHATNTGAVGNKLYIQAQFDAGI